MNIPTPITPDHPTTEFMTELADCATFGNYESIDDLIMACANRELPADIDDAVTALFETHWNTGTGDDALDEFNMAMAEMEHVPVLIAHYGSPDVAMINIVRGDAPINAGDPVMDAWDFIHTAYDVDDDAECAAMARLFGVIHATS